MVCVLIFLLIVWIIPAVAATGSTTSSNTTNTANVTLTADFSAVPTTGEAPLPVAFTDQSTGSPDRWEWDFGDGSTSTDQSPTHQYETAGSFYVSLTVWNGTDQANLNKDDLITVRSTPLCATFGASPLSGYVPLTVSFTDCSTGSPDSWQWDFGDGGRSGDKNPCHTYISSGTFNVTLKVGNGMETSTSRPRIIKVDAEPLKAAFKADPRSGTKPLTVSFTDWSTGKPTWWNWSFGDGTFYRTVDSDKSSPTHTYTRSGSFTISLTIGRGEAMVMETVKGYITISSDAGFTATPVTGQAPLSVLFTDTTPGKILKRCWSFGDNTWYNSTGDEGKKPTHLYQDAGNFTVALYITRDGGTDTVTRSKLITVPMDAQFSATPASGKMPLKVSFTDKSKGRPVSWCWCFGDGEWFNTTKQAKANVTHTYTRAGTYTVTLIVKSSFDSEDKEVKSKYITVTSSSASQTTRATSTAAPATARMTARPATAATSTRGMQATNAGSSVNSAASGNSGSGDSGGHLLPDLLMGGVVAVGLIGGYIILDRRKL